MSPARELHCSIHMSRIAEDADALRSALGRLKVAVYVMRDGTAVTPYNRRAVEMFEKEGLREDIVTSLPSHPLAAYVRQLCGDSSHGDASEVLTFPGGRSYRVEASVPSAKGPSRMRMLIVEPVESATRPGERLEALALTPREHDVATRMLRGESTDEICVAMSISRDTLRSHVKSILAKSGARSRTEFVAKLLR